MISHGELRRAAIRKQGGQPYKGEVGDGIGAIWVYGQPGYVWVREIISADSEGGVIYGEPYPVREGSGKSYHIYGGASVRVVFDPTDQEWEIDRNDFQTMVGQGLNPGATNPLNPYNKMINVLAGVPILLGHAIATAATPTMEVSVKPFVYVDAKGVFHAYQGGKIDLTSSVPSSGNHRLALVWLQTDDTLAVSISTAKNSSIDITVPVDLAECLASPPSARAVPSKAFKLYGGQTTVAAADEWFDIRQWINAPHIKNNFDASADPTVNDDETDGYETGSFWLNTTSGAMFVLTDPTATAAVWEGVSASAALADAVILAPGSSTRNLITPTGNFSNLVLRANSGTQSEPMLELQTEAGSGFFRIYRLNGVTANLMTLSGRFRIDGLDLDNSTLSTHQTNQDLSLTPNGTGKVIVGGDGLTVDTDLIIADASANTVDMVGAVGITGDLGVDNVNVNGNTISTTDTNGNLNLTPNGTGKVNIGADGLIVDTDLIVADASANTVDMVAAVGITGDLDVDNVNINGNTISTTDANGNLNLTPNGTGKVNIGADGLIIDTDLMIADASANTVDFVGAVNISGDLDVDNFNLNGNTFSTTAGGILFQPTAGQNVGVTVSGAGDFFVNTNQLYVDSSTARVGINDNSPDEALDVTGNIKLTGMHFNGSFSGTINAGATSNIGLTVGTSEQYHIFAQATNSGKSGQRVFAIAQRDAGGTMTITNVSSSTLSAVDGGSGVVQITNGSGTNSAVVATWVRTG